ncbi:hypothetical protein pipiens_016502 [Culex pipiens pipiens]|uniref:Ion transport domain-containing protein n=1 Tax=Culex pipiens pipiens TaxID=38569 RepID=A0ABD1CL13_CULPP
MTQEKQAPVAVPEETRLELEDTRQQKRSERKQLQISLQKALDEVFAKESINDGLAMLQSLLEDYKFTVLYDLIEEMKHWDTLTTIPEPKSFLFNVKLQPQLSRMLENSFRYRPYLECFIPRFDAVNEKICPDLNAPLHYAAEALNISFIEWLLAQPSIEVNARNKQRKTALFLLCEQYDACLNNPNFKKRALQVTKSPAKTDDIRECIRLLLYHGADFNMFSDRLKLPFELLMKNRSEDNKQFLKECTGIFQGAIAIGKTNELKQRVVGFYQERAVVIVTVELLELFLRFNEQDRFMAEFEVLNVNIGNVRCVIKLLLHTAVELNQERCVKKIVDQAGRKIFQIVNPLPGKRVRVCEPVNEPKTFELMYRLELKGLLKKACECGNVTTLGLLLGHITDKVLVNDDPILVITLNRAHELWKRDEERAKVLQCASLLAKDQKIFLTRTDNNGNTALHSALKFGFTDIALELLQQKYAFLGVRNKDNLTPLDYARYDFWKKYFDQCVTIDVRRSYFDRNEVRLNLNGFDPYIFKKRMVKKANQKDRSELNLWRIVEKASASNVTNKPEQSFVTEMDPVKIIAKSKDLQRLLVHPVVYTFIQVKWLRLTKWSYINLICTLITVFCFSWHSLDACDDGRSSIVPTVLTWIGAVYMIFREIIQVLFLRFNYLSTFENYLDIATITAMIVVLSNGCNSILSSITVIAFAMQITVLLGSLPFNSIATYMHMFKTVSLNFLLSFLLFIPLLASFTYSFYLSYNDQTTNSTTPEDDNPFNTFGTFSDAALKTLVMTTGEFEAAAVDFSGGKMLIFVLFIFFAPIVILNLINGLAVSDITAIRERSELISISKKVTILERYERGLREMPLAFIRRLYPSSFFENHSYVIVVRPNEMRKILVQSIEDQPADNRRDQRAPKGEWRVVPNIPGGFLVRGSQGLFVNFKFCKFPLFSTLDDHIMDEALRIVDQSIMVKEIQESSRAEIAASGRSLEADVKLEELRLEMEKMSRLLNKMTLQNAQTGNKIVKRKKKLTKGKKGKDVEEKFRKATTVAKAVGKFKKNKKNRNKKDL